MNKSIIIIGKISSGKSTLAREIHNSRSHCKIVSFGSYLKEYARLHSLKQDRSSLQNLGQEFIERDPEGFLRKVVDFDNHLENETLIFEGVRHKSIFDAINKYYPSILSVYLDIGVEVRYERYQARSKEIDKEVTYQDFLIRDDHRVEQEVELLVDLCDLILTTSSIEVHMESISNILDQKSNI